MLKLLLGVLVEVLVSVTLAGLILALAIPLLSRSGLAGTTDITATTVIISVLVGAVAIALFRPRSALHRYFRH